jgi:hypothetical protein
MLNQTPKISKCKVEIETVQRVRIIGPQSESDRVFEYLFANGFRVVRSGPYTNSKMHPKVDVSRFLFVAERVIDGNG